MRPDGVAEGRRWLEQALRDLDDARFARHGVATTSPSHRARGAGLDVYYIPTRYPNGLPGGLPADAFGEEDSERAVSRAALIIDAVAQAFAAGSG